MHKIDARGLACPQPVLLTKDAIAKYQDISVLVDNAAAKENVARFAKKQGCTVDIKEAGSDFEVVIKTSAQEGCGCTITETDCENIVVAIAGDKMGSGDDVLGGVLIRAFCHTIGEVSPKPKTIILYNSGVKLAVQGSEVLEDLQALEKSGIELLVCGTCLGHFEIKEQLAVGSVSNMYSIAEAMLEAGKVIRI